MPIGFHFYATEDFSFDPKRATTRGPLTVRPVDQDRGVLEVAAAFDKILDATMWVPEDQLIRVDNQEHSTYERLQRGTVLSANNFVMIRFPTDHIPDFVANLHKFDGVKLPRLCIPLSAMRASHVRLGSDVSGHGINNPTNPRRRKVRAYGTAMQDDR